MPHTLFAPDRRLRRALRRRLPVVAACLAAASALVQLCDAAETTRLRKRTARPRPVAAVNVPGAALSIRAPDLPEPDLAPPDTAPWGGGEPETSFADGEGTGDFMPYSDYFAAAGGLPAESPQEPVPYEPPLPTAERDPAAPATEARPAAKRGLRLRDKRAVGRETAKTSASGDGLNGAASAASPSITNAPPMPLPSNPATPASVPSAPADEGSQSGGREEVVVPAAPEPAAAEEETATTLLRDKYSDNTPANAENQEQESTNYDQDGDAAEPAPSLPDKGKQDVPAREEAPPPERIPSRPPPGREERFSPEDLARAASRPAVPPTPPTRMEVDDYRRRLEARLLERYNNLPEYVGQVGRVAVVLSKPLALSLDGNMIRAEFDQLVFDAWGKRIPELEDEYYVVTFGSGGARQVRSDPSIRVGLDLEKAYSERAPLSADPFARAPESGAFRSSPVPAAEAPKAGMPDWWRPDFPELR